MAVEWTYLSGNFPDTMPYFASWMELRDIAKDTAAISVISGRVSMLQIFGYHWKDNGPLVLNENKIAFRATITDFGNVFLEYDA
ncbi:hypothetical protein F5Y09DRAFT_341656 [Xylaria sp. FL1042]|nr:hypothetical protein F5Y09DRAFT_341656 [Xylaria sp. FL1042]